MLINVLAKNNTKTNNGSMPLDPKLEGKKCYDCGATSKPNKICV